MREQEASIEQSRRLIKLFDIQHLQRDQYISLKPLRQSEATPLDQQKQF